MEKRTLHMPDLAARNLEQIAEVFPTVMTESRDLEGNVVTAVDFDLLRQDVNAGISPVRALLAATTNNDGCRKNDTR